MRARRPSQAHPLVVLLSLAVCAIAGPTSADPLYSHLRIIAPAAPGGGWDQTARSMQQVLQTMGIATSASVENVPGAAGTIGLARLIDAERGNGDVVMVSGLIMLAAVAAHDSPVTLRDVTPIARLTGEYEVLVVPARSPYRTFTDLLDALRARPESIAWAGGSAGGADQILAGLIADAVGVSPRRVNYVAFAGGGESMAAILGGQVTVGISGLGEYAAQIAAGTVRILAISSPERLADVNAPTLREHGVDVVLEIWRSLVAPPGMRADDRARLEQAIAELVKSGPWRDTLLRYRWSDRYLAGAPFARFVADEDARVRSILDKLGGTAKPASPGPSIGVYPLLVIAGLSTTVIAFAVSVAGACRHVGTTASSSSTRDEIRSRLRARAVVLITIAMVSNLLLMERAGFVVASIPLYWLTARAFDATRPARDAVVAVVLSLGAYLLFTRVLQISLPAGVLGRFLPPG